MCAKLRKMEQGNMSLASLEKSKESVPIYS